MSHHGSSWNDEASKVFSKSKLYQKLAELGGATTQFPDGKLTSDDEGEIKFAVVTINGRIIIEFGQPVHWLGLTGEEAVDLGRLLLKRGRKILKPEDR